MTFPKLDSGGRLWLPGLLLPLFIGGAVMLGPWGRPARAAFGDRRVPSMSYLAAFHLFYEGDYKDALRQFQDELRGAIKTPQSHWIDSICYHTMIGECYYHMGGVGDLDKALFHYTAALELYLAFPDWLMWLTPPPPIRPAQPGRNYSVPWGESARGAPPGHYPETMLIGQGQINNNPAFQRGGVVRQAVLYPIHAQEIVRTTTLAIRRRTELLGPLCKHDPLTGDLIAALSRNPGPPNHWLQAWIDVQLGVALIAGGKETDAMRLLTRSVVAQGEYDHPLTSTALFELGRLALLGGEYTKASGFFHEATIAAVKFFDGGILEEAFRYGAVTHLAANRKGGFPALEPAAQWAKVKAGDLRRLRASLLLSAAENLLVLGSPRDAAAMLDEARAVIGRRMMGLGRMGARLAYLNATVLFRERNVVAGDEALAVAMGYMRHGSHWLYQIAYLDRSFAGQHALAPRKAMELYGELLRDPEPTDWTLQPMESLAVLRTPHPQSFEHWFLAALERKDHEAALEIADRARRHRFFSSLAYGGRLQSLRWILEAPDEVLDQQARLNREELLAKYPAYAGRSRQAVQIRAVLEKMPLVCEDADESLRQRKGLEELGRVSVEQEAILREMAVRREASAMVFPPVRSLKEIQKALPEGHVLLVFFAARGDLYAFLLNQDKYDYWRVKGTPLLVKRLQALLRAMGHFDENNQLNVKQLDDPEWKKAAQALLSNILDGSRADFTASFPELVVVPDGVMWYVPFESLLVDVEGEVRPLISRFRIRYAPTASLAVPDGRGRNSAAKTAVFLGRLFPRDEDSVAQAAFDDLARAVPRSVALSKKPFPGPTALYASLMNQLIVLDDLKLESGGPYALAPIPSDRSKPGNTLSDWLALPWAGPDVVILPGYHTVAEKSLKGAHSTAPGAEVFLTVCGLMSSGTRTVLMSRWRTGGQTSFDIVREFAQELPHTAPSDALQRAVLVITDSRLNLDAEPRVQRANVAEPPRATHPFFWSPYMLVDSGALPPKEEAKPEPPLVEFVEPKQDLQEAQAPQEEKPEE